MPITVTDVLSALTVLGGEASVDAIHAKVRDIAKPPLSKNSRQIVRARLQDFCPESGSYRCKVALFESVHGLSNAKGIWALLPGAEEALKAYLADKGDPQRQARNPIWSRDELILALALYRTNPSNPPGKYSTAVAELSAILNKMHRLNGVTANPTLRNENGVYLKMMNLRALDPAFVALGRVGMQSGGKLERVVWADYEGREEQLASDATLIREIVAAADECLLAKLPAAEPYEGEEGGVVMRLHKRYERDPRLVAEKRKEALATGKLSCEVCAFDFEATYGALGAGYIEVHHTTPVHTLTAGTKTRLADLALLCANCHRMAHRSRKPLTPSEIVAFRLGSYD